jgi:hypothetical protein
MSDVDAPVQEEQELSATDRLAEAVNRVQPVGGVVYPETDVMRAVLSGGCPAGNTDELPAGTDEMKAAMEEALAERWPVGATEPEAVEGTIELPAHTAGGR